MSRRKSRFISFFGFLVFVVGIVGILNYYWLIRQEKLEQFLPSDVALFSRIKIGETENQLQETFQNTSLKALSNIFPQENIPPSFLNKVDNWVGKEIGIALFEDNSFMLAFEYRAKDEIKDFMGAFKVPGETFISESFPDVEIITPSFSSNIAFGFHGRWFLVSDSSDTIKNIFSSTE